MDDKQQHEQRMAEIYQREVDYRQHGKVDIAATHDDIDYLWTRLRLMEREIAQHPARPLPAPTGEDGGA